MKTLILLILVSNICFAGQDPWGIKKAEGNKVFFNNSSIETLVLPAGAPDIEYEWKVAGTMKDGIGIPTVIYISTPKGGAQSDLAIARPHVDGKSNLKVIKWDIAQSGIPVPGNYYTDDQPPKLAETIRVLYGECLRPGVRIILSIRGKKLAFIEPEKLIGSRRQLSSNSSQGALDPSFMEIEKTIKSGKCKEIPGMDQTGAP